jgi:hypothetical protein
MADNLKDLESRVKTTATIVEDALRSIADRVSDIFEEAASETSNFSKTLEKDITKSINNLARTTGLLENNQSKLNLGLLKEKDIAKQLEDRKNKLLAIERQINISKNAGIIDDIKAKNLLEEVKIYNKELTEDLEKQLALSREYTKNLGISGHIFEGLSKTLQKFGIHSIILDDIRLKLNKASTEGKIGFNKLFEIVGEGFKESLNDPLIKFTLGLELFKSGIDDIKKSFKVFLEYNNLFTNISRSLGTSTEQIENFIDTGIKSQTNFNDKLQNNIYSASQIGQAFSDINNQLGLSVNIGQAATNEFAKMTNTMGLTVEEASKIQKLGLLNNLTLKDTNKAIISGIIAAQQSTGVQVNAKQIFQEIGNLSAGILVKFQQNPEALAKAVAQAKALGTNLETVDKIGDSLLNWESSIENQLKAELLTGKQINLERAREAALTGDQVTLVKEITSQTGSLKDYQKLNILAQRSLAEAFGMSRDEMVDMLQKQDIFNKLGDISGKSAKEQLLIAKQRGLSETDSLYISLQQQAATEQLANTWDNIKASVSDLLSGPFSGLVDLMSNLSHHAGLVVGAMTALAGISLVKTIGGLVLMASELAPIALEAGIAASALSLGLGTAAIIGAIALITGAIASAKTQTVPDGIAPSSNGPFTITDAYGRTAITTKGDGLAVSPNINRTTNNINDNQMLLDKIDKLILINEQQKQIAQQGRIQIWNDQIVARENIRSINMNNPIYFS